MRMPARGEGSVVVMPVGWGELVDEVIFGEKKQLTRMCGEETAFDEMLDCRKVIEWAWSKGKEGNCCSKKPLLRKRARKGWRASTLEVETEVKEKQH